MNSLGYIAEGNKMAELIAHHVYSPVSAIVEIVANFYDADAEEVKISFKEEIDSHEDTFITEVKISGDGEGITYDNLNELRNIGNSKKRNDIYTKKFKRTKLGAFGIAFTSFQILGNELEIYSKSNLEKFLYLNINVEGNDVKFSKIKVLDCCNEINYKTGCTIIIKDCKIPKSEFFNPKIKDLNYDMLSNKLSYLPLGDNFRIELCDEEVKRYLIDESSFNVTFDFCIDNIKFVADIKYSPTVICNTHYKGIFLQVDGRIIDWNIFNGIRNYVQTPGMVEGRIQGYVFADDLRNNINASRTGLTDNNLALRISNMIKPKISGIHKKAKKYYGWGKDDTKKIDSNKKKINNEEKPESNSSINTEQVEGKKNTKSRTTVITMQNPDEHNEFERREKADKRIKAPNKDLKRLGIKFCYEPESELEVIVIASQMCQKNLLDFDIIQMRSNEYPDSVIIKDGKIAFLEFEKSLHDFYIHGHNHNNVDYILCWSVDLKQLMSKMEPYLKKYSGYVNHIKYNDSDELTFYNYDGTNHVVKIYVISDIIKRI